MTISHNLLISCWQWEIEQCLGQVVIKYVGCLPSGSHSWQGSATVPDQHHERIMLHTPLAQKKNKIPNSKYDFYWVHIFFSIIKLKILSQIILSQRLCVVYSIIFLSQSFIIMSPDMKILLTSKQDQYREHPYKVWWASPS